MASEDKDHWPRLSLLDVLRPPPGWEATDVVLSTYSLDLVVLASVLLALTGRDTPTGGGSKTGLAHAISHFRPGSRRRLSVLVQSGRINQPRTSPKILALLDQFVREIKFDQRRASWHAKAALVRLQAFSSDPGGNQVQWRLWIGSRNLTRDISWDTGLVLCASEKNKGSAIEGLTTFAQALLSETEWPSELQKRLLAELSGVRWEMPEGVNVTAIRWLRGDYKWRPTFAFHPQEVAVITPFFDGTALDTVTSSAGETVHRSLLTTQQELDRERLVDPAPLQGWNITCLANCAQADEELKEEGGDDSAHLPEPAMNEEQDIPMGLHAKVIAARARSRARERVHLHVGSANVTTRAWGRNAELVVSLEGGAKLWEGIEALMLLGNDPAESQVAECERPVREWLSDLRNALSELDWKQSVRDERLAVFTKQSLRSMLTPRERQSWNRLRAELYVGALFARAEDYQLWEPESDEVELGISPGSLAGESEFLCFRLRAESDQLGWVQHIPLNPRPQAERDRRILAEYLSPSQFMGWLNAMLLGFENDTEQWFSETPYVAARRGGRSHMGSHLPSLETILKAWQRDSRSLRELSASLKRYLNLDELRALYEDRADRHIIDRLEDLQRLLKQMEQALGTAIK